MRETALATVDDHTGAVSSETIEKVVMGGDLAKLTSDERRKYYDAVCKSLGLNPLTMPFAFLPLNGRLVMYALKNCTDQLRKLHAISIKIVGREKIGDVYVVTAQAIMPDGREDESTGAVYIGSSKGEALANAYMRAETKAKRRSTLSIVGLSVLDESELETVPRTEPPATRQAHLTGDEPSMPSAPEHSDVHAFLLGEIMDTLKRAVPGGSPEDRERRARLITEAFGVKGWTAVSRLTAPQLQAGYGHLQELVTPDETETIEDAEPVAEDDVPLSTPPDTPVESEADVASPEDIAALRDLAQQVGNDAYADLQDALEHHEGRMPRGTYDTIKTYLDKRLTGHQAAQEGSS